MAEESLDRAISYLRGHTRGELRFDEHWETVRYTVDAQGCLVMPVMVAMLRATDTVLFVPEAREGAMEIQLSFEEFTEQGEGGAAADRWRIYHGEPKDVRWARMFIDGARFEGLVIDGDVLMARNPLADCEARVCKQLNQQPELVKRMTDRHAVMRVEKPVVVGADWLGFDVRAAFDVVRVAARRPMLTQEQALALAAELANG